MATNRTNMEAERASETVCVISISDTWTAPINTTICDITV